MRALLTATVLILLISPALPAQQVNSGEWNYVPNQDAVTQEQTDFIMFTPLSNDYGLGVKCFDSGPMVMIALSDVGDQMAMVTSEDVAFVSYRVGSQVTRGLSEWNYKTNDDVAFSPNADGRRILNALLDASGTLGFKLYNGEGESVMTDEVPLQGARRLARRLSCAGEGSSL